MAELSPQASGFAVDKSGDKAVAHLLAIMFFSGLLVALAVILEQLVKGHWTEIVAALRGAPVQTVSPAIQPAGRRAAA